MVSLANLSQQQVADLLRATALTVEGWAPPAPDTVPILRAAPPGYILTWAGAEHALPGLVGLKYLLALMDRAPTAMHVADIVDPTGHARAGLGQVMEADAGGRMELAGESVIRTTVQSRIRVALALITKACPAAREYLSSRLTTGRHCRFGVHDERTGGVRLIDEEAEHDEPREELVAVTEDDVDGEEGDDD